MKKLILITLVTILSSAAYGEVFKIQTRVANDYVLLDSIKSIRLAETTNLPGVFGSKATLEVIGDIAVRGCDYSGFALFLQPRTTGQLNFHSFNVTVSPLYQGDNVEISSRGCRSIVLGVEAFEAMMDIVVRPNGVSRWLYSFLGTNGVKLRIIEVSYNTTSGWSMKDL